MKANAADLANQVLEHHFGSGARELKEETSGASNHVFTAEHDRGVFVLRLSPEQDRVRAYYKECWAMERVRAHGVPTPEVLDVGAGIVPWPYMLMGRVAGHEATTHPKRSDILRALGEHAARINSIATDGFGDVFDWAPADVPRNASWRAFLFDELQLERKLEVLAAHAMVSAPQLAETREARRPKPARKVEARIPRELDDALGVVAARLDARPSAFRGALIRYYLWRVARDQAEARRVCDLAQTPEAEGTPGARISMRVDAEVLRAATDRVRALGLRSESDMYRGIVLAALDDVFGAAAREQRSTLEAIAAAAV